MEISRRDFLKVLGVTAILPPLLHLKPVAKELVKIGEEASPVTEGIYNKHTMCTLCSTVCDIVMHVKKVGGREKVIKIDGNPNSPINRGKTCARGQSGVRRLYNPNRLKYPLIRVEGSKRGEWKFRRATWEEAYQYIAKRLKEEGIKPYEMVVYGGMIACAFYRPFFIAYALTSGSPNIIGPTLQNCVLGEHFGIATLTGNFNVHDELIADYERASVILVVGSNSSLAGISTSRATRLGKAIENGAKLIVLDPRLSETAAKAHVWLPVKPGTDLAFTLALINKLISERKYDDEFVRYYTNAPFLIYTDSTPPEPVMDVSEEGRVNAFYVYDEKSGEIKKVPGYINTNAKTVDGEPIMPALEPPELKVNGRPVKTAFQLLKEAVSSYTLEWAAQVMDVPLEKVKEAAELFVNQRPALVEPGWYDSRFEATPQLRKSCAILQALVGGFDRPGGWRFAGEYREHLKRFWEGVQRGEYPKIPIFFPGIMGPYLVCRRVICNPEFWPHGFPSVPQAWVTTRREKGEPGVAFPLFSDIGYLDSVEGRLTWNGKPYVVKAMFIFAGNPMRAGVDTRMWERILTHENMKLVVVSDIVPSDTALYADVILPDLSYMEKFDPVFSTAPSPALGFRMRDPVEPISKELKHLVDVMIDLSKILGSYQKYIGMLAMMFMMDPKYLIGKVEEAYSKGESPAKAIFEEHAKNVAKSLGMSYEDFVNTMKEKGVLVLKGEDEMVEEIGVPFDVPVPTPSGRLEIYSNMLLDLIRTCKHFKPNCHPVISYVPPVWKEGVEPTYKPDYRAGEFFLVFGKVPLMSYASTADIDLLGALVKKVGPKMHWLWMSREAADALGIKEGDVVEITNNVNPDYKIRVPVHVTGGIRPDTVFLPGNFGQTSPAWRDIGELGAPLNMLIPHRIGPLVGVYKAEEFTVTVRKVGG